MKLTKLWELWGEGKSRDLHAYAGLALIGAGMWMFWQPGAFIAIGVGLLYFAFRA